MRTLADREVGEGADEWLDLVEALSDGDPSALSALWSEARTVRVAEARRHQERAKILETASRVEPVQRRKH